MSRATYLVLCWLTFIPIMVLIWLGMRWLDVAFGLWITGPMAVGVLLMGYFLKRWEEKHGSLLSRQAEPEKPAKDE